MSAHVEAHKTECKTSKDTSKQDQASRETELPPEFGGAYGRASLLVGVRVFSRPGVEHRVLLSVIIAIGCGIDRRRSRLGTFESKARE